MISYPRGKTRQQAQDYRRFQQAQFGGGQNSDTPATKIGPSEMALMRNVASYGEYFEGHYGIQVNSDERDPGSGTRHSLEQHPVTGRWLLHRGSQLWLSAGHEQAEWTEVAAIGTDGVQTASGTFLEYEISGDAAAFLSDLVVTGWAGTGALTIKIESGDSVDVAAVTVLLDGNIVSQNLTIDASSQPVTDAVVFEFDGSGISATVTVDGWTNETADGAITVPLTIDFSLSGLTPENTDNYKLYWNVDITGNADSLSTGAIILYKDAAKLEEVARGEITDPPTRFVPYNGALLGSSTTWNSADIPVGIYPGSPDLIFSAPLAVPDAPSGISFFGNGFMVYVRGAAPKNVFVDDVTETYMYKSERPEYGNFPIGDIDVGSGFEYRYIYTRSRILNTATGEPDYNVNRITGKIAFESPTPAYNPDYEAIITLEEFKDYGTALSATEISDGDPLNVPLNYRGIPVGEGYLAGATHTSLYRTLNIKNPTTNPEQYIWVADLAINVIPYYADGTSDEVLLARLEAGSTSPIPYIYALPSRGWREMDRGVGAIRTDFMFTAFPDTPSTSYCDVQVIPRLIGYHNPLQRNLLQDPVSHLTSTRELAVIVCPSSAYALTTGINQDVGGGLYYIPIITNFERVSGNVGVASRYKLFRVDESSFLAYCTDHTIRIFSAMSWGSPLDGTQVHKTVQLALGDAKIAFIRGVVFFWFMDGLRPRCLRYGTGGNTGSRWTEIERDGWIYPDLVSTQETDEALLKLTTLGAADGVFYAIENEAPDRIYEDESPVDAPVLRGAGAAQLSGLAINGWNGAMLYGRMISGSFRLYGSQADANADANIMGQSDVVAEPTDAVPFYGVVNGTVDILEIADCYFTVINGVAVGSLLPIPSPFRFRDLTATVEAFICAHMISHVYMRFPYGMPAPTVKARWYADGVLADSSNQVPEDGEIQSFRNVKGKRIQLELEPQSSGWQVTAYDTEYQTQDIRLVRGPWNSNEAAIQKEIASDMISWVNSVSGVKNRADRRTPKQNYQGVVPARTAGPFVGKFGQDFTEQDTFTLAREVTTYTLMFWGRSVSGVPVSLIEDGVAAAFISFPDPATIDIGSFQYALTSPADDGFWHHYAVTRDDSWFRVYQDGIEIGANQLSPGSLIALASMTLGIGNLYDPRNYSKALSAAAIEYYVTHPEQLP